MSVVRHYEFLDRGVQVECSSHAWAEGVQEILGAYRCQPLERHAIHATLLHGSKELERPRGLEERGRFDGLVFHYHPPTQKLWIDVHGRGWVEVDPSRGRIDAALDYEPREDEWFVAHHAFYPALLEILKSMGYFPAHAGLVAREDDGLLICGASGSGKTTLSLNLATNGWEFLADDTCFLRSGNEAVEGHAFWEDLHVTEETIARFESLDFLRQQIPRRANWKRHFAVEQLEALRPRERCRPRWIVFPRVVEGRESQASELSSHEALLRLLPQSVIPAHPENTARHFELLSALVSQLRAFEFSMGEDLAEVRDRLEGTLLEAAR